MDLFDILAGAAVIAAFPAVMVVMSRAIAPDGAGACDLFKAPAELGWPHGVQEEEPVRWRVELLERAGAKRASRFAVGAVPERTFR